MDEDEKKMLFNEINNLKDLDHPNILKMYEFFEDEKRYYIVTDICKGESSSMRSSQEENSLSKMLQFS